MQIIARRAQHPGHRKFVARLVIPRLYFGMKTAISLPDLLFEEADLVATRLGISRSQLYASALAEYLARHRESGITDALDRVYASENAAGDVAQNRAARAALRRAEWT